jgi:hypothetical protein
MNVNQFAANSLRLIKEVMGRNLIDRSFRVRYGAFGSATVKYVVCERAWRPDHPRRAFIGFSGAGDHRRGR